jgi:subtilisin family serine protease
MTFRLKLLPAIILVGTLIAQTPVGASAAVQDDTESLIIQTSGSLTSLLLTLESLGGTVTHEYESLNAVAADVRASALDDLEKSIAQVSIVRDTLIAAPTPTDAHSGRSMQTTPAYHGDPSFLTDIAHDGSLPITEIPRIDEISEFAHLHANAYLMNHSADNVQSLHADGLTGEGVIVAVIDSRLRQDFGHFDSTVGGSVVVGCENFIALFIDPRGCDYPTHDGHGTMVSGIIVGKSTFRFTLPTELESGSLFFNSVGVQQPAAALDLDTPPGPESVAVAGSVPGAQIYMLKVFVDGVTPSPSSVILDAVNRVIELKTVERVNIQVANLSLGSWTLHAGRRTSKR